MQLPVYAYPKLCPGSEHNYFSLRCENNNYNNKLNQHNKEIERFLLIGWCLIPMLEIFKVEIFFSNRLQIRNNQVHVINLSASFTDEVKTTMKVWCRNYET